MLRLYVIVYLAFLAFPIAIITLFAFHASSALSFPFEGLSLRWFKDLLIDSNFVEAFKNSIIVAVATAVATTILGTVSALAVTRLPAKSRAAFAFLGFAPIALPGLFLGISLAVLFDRLGVYRSLWTVTIAHTLFCLPFFIETVRSRVTYFDHDLELAARDLGATPWQAFRRVTLPILGPTLVGGAILSFALSFDEIIITAFVIGEEGTLPFYILSLMRRTVTPLINAASVLAIVITLATLSLAWLVMASQRRLAMSRRTGNDTE